jgi:Mg-chelatase subunit ChlD
MSGIGRFALNTKYARHVKFFGVRIIGICLLALAVFTSAASVFASPSLVAADTVNTTTILVIDTSGSMDDLLATGESKLSAAKNAGRKLLDIIGAENEVNVGAHKVAIVEFSDSAFVDIGFTDDIYAAQNALANLYTTGGTAMPKGLRTALDLFPSTITGKPFIILLSDGIPNIGLNDEYDNDPLVRQQVLDLAGEAGGRGICVYTVGFGDPAAGTIDEAFLTSVARQSGCGEYHNAQNAWELANVYINLRHSSTGATIMRQNGSIHQNETVNLGTATVPDNQEMMLCTLSWPGSQLNSVITDPKGIRLDPVTYPSAHMTTTDTLISLIIQNPLPGNWNVAVYGAQVPNQTTFYSMVCSVRQNPNPPPVPIIEPPAPLPSMTSSPFMVILVVLAVAGVIVYTLTQTAKRSRTAGVAQDAPATLIGLSGSFAGRRVIVNNGMLIGRSHLCAVRLSDPSASRTHARLSYARGQWYIQDMNSQGGIYVNGMRVQTTVLSRGARIRIADTEFEFR